MRKTIVNLAGRRLSLQLSPKGDVVTVKSQGLSDEEWEALVPTILVNGRKKLVVARHGSQRIFNRDRFAGASAPHSKPSYFHRTVALARA
jgi:hypothetical protein